MVLPGLSSRPEATASRGHPQAAEREQQDVMLDPVRIDDRCPAYASFPERTDRVAALRAMQAQAAVTELGKLFPSDPFAGEHARQDKVEDRGPVVHPAGGNAEDRNHFGMRNADFGT
jgi:hypothetical protein